MVVDSYEQSPVYTYPDTGWYSVNLTVFNDYDTNTFLRENYIYVDKATYILNRKKVNITYYPNPFSDYVNILIPTEYQNQINKLTIYNISGEIIKTINTNKNNIIWDSKSTHGSNCPPGIYFIKFNNHKFANKVLISN